MARLYRDLGTRTVVLSAGRNKGKALGAGMSAVLYSDADGTVLANIAEYDSSTPDTAGDPVAGSTLTVDAYSDRPAFWDLDDLDQLYITVNDGPLEAIYPDAQPQIVGLAGRVTALEPGGTGAAATAVALTAEATARATADTAEATARAAADSLKLAKASNLSDLASAATARANMHIGAARPTLAFGLSTAAAGSNPRPIDYFGGYLYGAVGTSLQRSADDGATWTAVATTPFEVQRLIATSDGEVIFTSDSRLYRSSGWSTNPATATWTLKLTANGSCSFFRFGIDGNGTKFIASQYSTTRADSRYVYISTDSGATWTQVWDTVALWPATNAESHLHGCCYDPWEDRFWIVEGHGTTGTGGVDNPRGMYYSSNNGSTWTRVSGGYADSLAALPTVLVATDDGIVCGTDDHPNGIMGIRRAPAGSFTLDVSWSRWEPKAAAYGFAERGFRDATTGIVYIGYRAEYSTTTPYIAAGTASSGGLVWNSGVAAASDKVQNLCVTASGKLIALYWNGGGVTANIVQGTIGLAGTPEVNGGNILGGSIAGGNAMAVGMSASAAGASSTAVGGLASASGSQGTAVGYSAAAAGNATAVGQDAQASGSDKTVAVGTATRASAANTTAAGYGAVASGASSTAVGSTSSATGSNATAVGKSASAVGNATAVGTSATASGSDQSSAFGVSATASGARSTAVGYSASASATDSTTLGVTATGSATSATAIGSGAAAGSTGTAVGQAAAASGSVQSSAFGATATASGTRATAIGYGATASSTDATVLGTSASGTGSNATALGKSASAVGNGTAIGVSATASGADQSSAFGATATAGGARATAVGYAASAASADSTAVGTSASAPGSTGTAIGKAAAATASGTAVGANSVASGTDLATALGTSAQATATRGLALGHSSVAGHDRGVALGYASSTTAASQVQVGARHFEIGEFGSDPAAPGADTARLYVRDNGSGKSQLCVRFPTGVVQVIATEP